MPSFGGWCMLGPTDELPPTVYPLDDIRPHDVDSPDCWCSPRWDDGVLVHKSMDRREEYEQGRRPS